MNTTASTAEAQSEQRKAKPGGDWILTFTGKEFHPLNPSPAEVCIEDIAHALSLQCRYTGQCKRFYSVAEHSVQVAMAMPRENSALVLAALLHDASEAYLPDLARPVKHRAAFEIRGEYRTWRAVEAHLLDVIFAALDLTCIRALADGTQVKYADTSALLGERLQLMPSHDYDWRHSFPGIEPMVFDADALGVAPKSAEIAFLALYKHHFRALRALRGSTSA